MSFTPNPFLSGLPALCDTCHEIAIVCNADATDALRRAIGRVLGIPSVQLGKRVRFFEMLDTAFACAQEAFPHELLELRRQRIRSGTWPTSSAKDVVAG
jgi:hypothetical protein